MLQMWAAHTQVKDTDMRTGVASMFDAYKRFFHFAGKQKGTWYKGMAFELLRSILRLYSLWRCWSAPRLGRAEHDRDHSVGGLWIMAVSVAGAALCWYLAHNGEGHANYRMCAEKRIHIGERMKYMPMGYLQCPELGQSHTAVATSTMEDLESMSFAVIARTVVGMIRTTIFSLAILCFDWRIGLGIPAWHDPVPLGQFAAAEKSRELSPGRLAAQTRLVDAVLEYIQGT